MKIIRFEFQDLKTNWHLEEVSFDPFNLLVGASGVGKTKILRSLERVSRLATEGEYSAGHIQWTIEFEEEGQLYQWQGRTEPASSFEPIEQSAASVTPSEIVQEKIINDKQEIIVERDGDKFVFWGKALPKLRKTVSAITLLAGEEKIAPLSLAFKKNLFSQAHRQQLEPLLVNPQFMADFVQKYRSISDLHGPGVFIGFQSELPAAGVFYTLPQHIIYLAYVIQEIFPKNFDDINDVFVSIFPSVEEMRISLDDEGALANRQLLQFTIRERGVDVSVPQPEISSGMLRVLVHLFEISCAPTGSVIVIDEFENSLGKNCMPQLTDFIMSRAPDLQFFMTSHHPYVINKIPIDTWKLVQRRGGRVRVVSARDIPALQAASHHDAFDRLLNLPEFEEGIA